MVSEAITVRGLQFRPVKLAGFAVIGLGKRPRNWPRKERTSHLGEKKSSTLAISIRNTDPGSNAGIPGISLPAGLSNDGMPIGVELDGPSGSDRRLLAIAEAVERILPVTPAPDLKMQ
jgi:Asp-tRNA(Asn)/Glu-tRNA(Gln) amidotransferase A subunit family amidase